ncbi:MAG: TnpV protein [Oscillospiraceae bacterium]|nr:TnpV protein [Oscillospiraceae bacterium]
MALIDYTRHGDYLLPNIVLNEPPRELPEPITKYGAMRRSYLKEHRTITYNRLLLTERLFPHLREVQRSAQARLDKAADGLALAAHMTEIRRIAEKMMLDEVVYA